MPARTPLNLLLKKQRKLERAYDLAKDTPITWARILKSAESVERKLAAFKGGD